MRQASLRTLTILGALVGLGGCVTGSIEGDPGAEAQESGAGAQPSGAGGSKSGGGGAVSGGNASHAGSSSAAGSPSAGTGNTPQGGSGSSAGNGAGGTGNGNAGSNGTAGSGPEPGTPHDCKRGIGWHGSTLNNAQVNSKLTWWYTWGLGIQSLGAGLEFTPMVWGAGASAADVAKGVRDDAKYLLGFNEPNFFAQANLSAAQAANGWPVLQTVAQQKNLKLVSPAVNYCGDDQAGTGPCHDTNPVSYLTDFFAACQGCQVDYVAVHWYNCDGKSLNSYLDLFKQFNRPIWLTEFACAYGGDTSAAGQEKYMREAIPILEGRADVMRYSWFSGDPMPNARLLNGDGTPTALGQIYLDLPHGDPTCTP